MACFFLFSWLLPSTYTKEIWNHQTIWNITTKIYKSRLPQRYTNDCYPKSIQIKCPKPPKYIKILLYNLYKRLLPPAYIKHCYPQDIQKTIKTNILLGSYFSIVGKHIWTVNQWIAKIISQLFPILFVSRGIFMAKSFLQLYDFSYLYRFRLTVIYIVSYF